MLVASQRCDSMMYSEGHWECWRQSLTPDRKPSVSTVTGTGRRRQMHSRMSEDLRVTTEGCGGRRSGVPSLCQRFQLSPSTLVTIYEHDLPTLQLSHSAPSPTSRTPQLHQTTPPSIPLTLWPAAPTETPQCKPFDRTCKTIKVTHLFLNASTCTHPRSQTGPLCSHWGVSASSPGTGAKVTRKKNPIQ